MTASYFLLVTGVGVLATLLALSLEDILQIDLELGLFFSGQIRL